MKQGGIFDYPDGKTAYNRFKKQGVLTDPQIKEAMDNTNVFLEVEIYDSPVFNKKIKMPILPKYKNNTKEERDEIFTNLVEQRWMTDKKEISEDQWEYYKSEIDNEVDVIKDVVHSDYFLLDYEIIKEGKADGGVITASGRGSAVSYETNKLLGLTTVDRIASPVKMYPDRFISRTRILETLSIVDIDINCANPEVFEAAQKRILGEDHAYPMIADGTLRVKAAWKMFARSQNIDVEISNKISQQIEKYEKAIKYADSDEDREEISIHSYIDKKYHELFEQSTHYLGVIDNFSPHPCASVIYSGSIRKEIGLIMLKAKATKKEKMCSLMDGIWAENYKFLKNDLLKVSVVELIDNVFKRIGIPHMQSNELLKICEGDQKVWDVYGKGFSMGINQVEQNSTSARATKYKPTNISELTAFVAAIRPGFRSLYPTFEKREPFSYGIKSIDDLIQTPQFKQSFILYQENQMAILNFAGIPMTECYAIIKNISKKRVAKVLAYKNIFLDGMSSRMIEKEHLSESEAKEISDKIWQIIEDSSQYSFCASHAYCVALDSLYGAYLKSHYPLYFYEVFLKILEAKGDKDRMSAVKKEAEKGYGIYFPKMLFRQNNTEISLDLEKNQITNSLKSIKGFSKNLADFLYTMKDLQFSTFIDLLKYIEDNGTLSTKIGDLIQIQYFDEFGQNGKLLELYKEFKDGKSKYSKKHTDKTKEKRIADLYEMEANIADYEIGIKDQMDIEREKLGYLNCTYDVDKRNVYVVDVDTKYAPRITCYSLATGKTQSFKMKKALFKFKPIAAGDVIYVTRFKEKNALKKVGDDFVEQEEKQWWIEQFNNVNHLFT